MADLSKSERKLEDMVKQALPGVKISGFQAISPFEEDAFRQMLQYMSENTIPESMITVLLNDYDNDPFRYEIAAFNYESSTFFIEVEEKEHGYQLTIYDDKNKLVQFKVDELSSPEIFLRELQRRVDHYNLDSNSILLQYGGVPITETGEKVTVYFPIRHVPGAVDTIALLSEEKLSNLVVVSGALISRETAEFLNVKSESFSFVLGESYGSKPLS